MQGNSDLARARHPKTGSTSATSCMITVYTNSAIFWRVTSHLMGNSRALRDFTPAQSIQTSRSHQVGDTDIGMPAKESNSR